MDNSVTTIRMVHTQSSVFNSDEDNKQCCIYDLDLIQLNKTFLLNIPYSYNLREDNFKKVYYPEVSYFYFYNIGNFIILLFSILSLLFEKHKFNAHFIVIAQLFLIVDFAFWIMGY